MSEYVKQHYVPQFYFRNFAQDERVCTYHLENEEGYPPTPISNICYESGFYGDAEHEQQLSKLESEMASVIHDIVNQVSFDPIQEDDTALFMLDLFLSFTHSRTKAAREEASELTQEVLEMVVEMGVEYNELDSSILEKVREREIRLEGPDHAIRQLVSMFGPVRFADLSRALIWNDTGRRFITSDHPVVFDNSRFKHKVDGGTLGQSARGLQVFCPLSPNLLLLLFDPHAYQIDANSENTVIVTDESVIADLNKLQLLNCLEACYYGEETDADWVHGLYKDVKHFRREEQVQRDEIQIYDEEEGRERELIRTHQPEIEFTPSLTFLHELPQARFTHIRSPELNEIAEEMYNKAVSDAWDAGDEVE